MTRSRMAGVTPALLSELAEAVKRAADLHADPRLATDALVAARPGVRPLVHRMSRRAFNRKLRSLHGALDKLMEIIELHPEIASHLADAACDASNGESTILLPDWLRFAKAIQEITGHELPEGAAVLHPALGGRRLQERGAPVQEGRRELLVGIAEVLLRHGYRITTARDGFFGKLAHRLYAGLGTHREPFEPTELKAAIQAARNRNRNVAP